MRKLIEKNSKELIVFFCGWSIGPSAFMHLEFTKNILFVFDFKNICCTKMSHFDFDFSKYEKVFLLAHSYGVYFANLFKFDVCFAEAIAVNGTLKPIDKQFGIVPKIFDLTMKNISVETLNKFQRKMFSKENDYEIFNKNNKNFDLKSLIKIMENVKSGLYFENNLFNKAILSRNDKIFPFLNMKNFWQPLLGENSIKIIDDSHFPFYSYKNIEELFKNE